MRNAILYQAYGSIDFINECKYALLKQLQVYNLKPPADTSIIIYTDQPHLFSDFFPFFQELKCISLPKETVEKWRGPNKFVHRLKIKMIADFMRSFEGNVLYCDTDTYFIKPLENIFHDINNGFFYMHEYEGIPDKTVSPSFHKWEAFLSSNAINYNNKELSFSKSIKVFNAGVVGLNNHHKEVLSDVLALTDSIYQKFPKHIAEQFAFSYVLQQRGIIKPADDVVAHYWNLKEFRELLSIFFKRNIEESIPNLVKKVHHIDALSMQNHKNAYRKLPLLQRFIKNLSGSAWRIRQYEKKL